MKDQFSGLIIEIEPLHEDGLLAAKALLAKATDRLGQLWNLDRFSPTRRVTFPGSKCWSGIFIFLSVFSRTPLSFLPFSSSNCCQDT